MACRTSIEKAQALASYSRPGNPHNNALVEASWSTLKTELLPDCGAFVSLKAAYYLDRRHSALSFSPILNATT